MSLLSIGKSGLLAAQVQLSTTGNNITNANVAGYSRQQAIQNDTPAQYSGAGFTGTGTEVSTVRRYYDDFLANSLRAAEATQSTLDTYTTQIAQVDNLLADTTAGLSPALQDFFNGVQDAASNPSSAASRQAMLSAADSLVSRFRSMSARVNEISSGINAEIGSTVSEINSYSKQLAAINNTIAGLSVNQNQPPNDLLDQRDQILTELNKLVKIDVVKADNGMVNATFGTGQPLVIGATAYQLAVTSSPTDAGRMVIGYATANKTSTLPDTVFTGGQLGGLLQVRDGALDQVQNQLGQVAASLATAFNAQHVLGQDQNGAAGGLFFAEVNATVGANVNNSPASTAVVSGKVVDASALTASDYSVDFDGTNFTVTRLSDNKKTLIDPYPQTTPQVIDGVEYTITGTGVVDDNFLVRPTAGAASNLQLLISDPTKVALAAPISTAATTGNTGSAKISPGAVDASYLGNPLASSVTISYDKATGSLSGFPSGQDVTVSANGSSTTYPAGTAVPYTDGATLSFGGISFQISGAPADTDSFTVGPNISGTGDSRNGTLLAALQTKNLMNNNTATFQTTYAQMVNYVGTKAREAQIAGTAADAAVTQATNSQQAVSGVNLDEEAANLLRYQQAYQASGKVIQIASQLFDTLLSLGN
jgi:flagellar hook-associated protein 1 FlgK